MSWLTKPHPRYSINIDAHEEVIERRAPTDESVRLISEMERAAEAQVFARVKVPDTQFAALVKGALDQGNMDRILIAVFSLGGHKIEVRTRADSTSSPDEHVDQLIRDISARVAEEVVRPCLRDLVIQGIFGASHT